MTKFVSSTQAVPQVKDVPRHVAIIMDGNGRWARSRLLPRVAGHKRGGDALRAIVRAAAQRGVEYLTVFAFSSENWRRPADEVSTLMQLFLNALEKEVDELHQNGIRFRVVGELDRFGRAIVDLIERGEKLTQHNTRMTLTIAANYGGRWDILQAMQRLIAARSGQISDAIAEADLAPYLAMHYAPEPDLFIRTGGEQRISNFLLWQLAYSELYFTDALWPDFDAAALDRAFDWYRQRERRFGRTSEQVLAGSAAASSADV